VSAQSDARGAADHIVEEVISARSGVRVGGAVRSGGTPIAVSRRRAEPLTSCWGAACRRLDAFQAFQTLAVGGR